MLENERMESWTKIFQFHPRSKSFRIKSHQESEYAATNMLSATGITKSDMTPKISKIENIEATIQHVGGSYQLDERCRGVEEHTF